MTTCYLLLYYQWTHIGPRSSYPPTHSCRLTLLCYVRLDCTVPFVILYCIVLIPLLRQKNSLQVLTSSPSLACRVDPLCTLALHSCKLSGHAQLLLSLHSAACRLVSLVYWWLIYTGGLPVSSATTPVIWTLSWHLASSFIVVLPVLPASGLILFLV